MARAVRIELFLEQSGRRVLCVEPKWWDASELANDRRLSWSNSTGSYFDLDAELRIGEFQELHERYRKHLETGLYALPGWRERLAPIAASIDLALDDHRGRLSHAHLLVYEWDSGY